MKFQQTGVQMKSKFLFFILTLLICGLAFAAGQQNSGAQNQNQKPTSQNAGSTKSTAATETRVTGKITKIDTKLEAITIRETSMGSSESGKTGSDAKEAASGSTHTFKYDTNTRFIMSNTGNYTGTTSGSIDDFKVGDRVVIMRDNTGMITSIQKMTAPIKNQQ